METDVRAISVSRDGKWIVCGSSQGASMWNAKTQEKAIEVEGTDMVNTVDISPDSARFATTAGTRGYNFFKASIWNIVTGERLVGPLYLDCITAIKFSPNGKLIAAAIAWRSICIFDSRNGDKLITIYTDVYGWFPFAPLAWSNNGVRFHCTLRPYNRVF